jgi:hypothetical protein
MPYGLRVLSKVLLVFAFVLPILAVILLLTHGAHFQFFINGKQVTYDEFMRQRGFFHLFLFGIFCAILVYGFLHASRWSRPMCFLPLAVQFILSLFHPQPPLSVALRNYLILICEVTLLAWYLFYRGTVKNYYSRMQGASV